MAFRRVVPAVEIRRSESGERSAVQLAAVLHNLGANAVGFCENDLARCGVAIDMRDWNGWNRAPLLALHQAFVEKGGSPRMVPCAVELQSTWI